MHYRWGKSSMYIPTLMHGSTKIRTNVIPRYHLGSLQTNECDKLMTMTFAPSLSLSIYLSMSTYLPTSIYLPIYLYLRISIYLPNYLLSIRTQKRWRLILKKRRSFANGGSHISTLIRYNAERHRTT